MLLLLVLLSSISIELLECSQLIYQLQLLLELQTKVPEDYAKFHNHREDNYCGLFLVESTY